MNISQQKTTGPMRVIFEIEHIGQLNEIQHWLADKKIVIERIQSARITADTFLKRLQQYRVQLPVDYRFNRDEANER